MIKHVILVVFVLFSFNCDRQLNPLSFTIDYVSSFSTEPRPIAIAAHNGNLYVANSNPYRNNDTRKIQKYNSSGELLKTVVYFASFESGKYLRYHPIDIALDDDQNLYVLVKPFQKYFDDEWASFEGFCILKFDKDDEFEKELDFAQFDQEWFPAAIACYDEYVFITNGRILKKISFDNENVFDIALPVHEENGNTRPEHHTTDMAINAKGVIHLVGQAAFGNEAVGSHITRFYPENNQCITVYAKGRTESFAAMLNNPGLAIGRDGKIYLATFYCESLEIYSRVCEFLMQLDVDDEKTLPIDVAVDNTHIYLVDNFYNRINVYKKR